MRLKFRRYFTNGKERFDSEVERKARIVGADGEPVFEQDVTAPAGWSDTAVNIVAQKYFRVVDGVREGSVHQMMWRVVGALRDAGVAQGYLDDSDPDSADAFAFELFHVLVGQMAAFNSPVYFNVGVRERPTSSACFLLELEDTMYSILDTIRTEGMIFKGGGGSGVNLSPLRARGERLSIGGTSSGPLSFMKALDANAGSIKSGGSSRRAACMRVMDVDHPDVEEFVWCKVREERKARVLEAAGYGGGIEGEAVQSVFYQNANNSVRITDEFMRAVKDDLTWELRGRVDRSVNRTVRARDLFRQIAKAAHECGDPGVQFHDTCNRWNTTPQGGEITTTNPCQPSNASVLTPTGLSTMGDIQVGDVIWSGDRWTKVVRKVSTGNKEVFRYRTTVGAFVGTEDHQVFSEGHRVKVGVARKIDRCVGPVFGVLPVDDQDVVDGWVLGDGTIHKASNDLVLLDLGKDDVDVFNNQLGDFVIRSRPGVGPFAHEVVTSIGAGELPKTYDREIPHRYRYGSSRKVVGFLRGLYAANGSVCGGRVTLKASSIAVVDAVQEMLSSLGIRSYYSTNKRKSVRFNNGTYECKQSYDLNITKDRRLFRDLIGFIHPTKSNRLHDICTIENSKKTKETYEIKSRESLGTMPVFDIEVDAPEHSYWTGGLKVSNCSEVSYINNVACNLASINLLRYLREDGSFDVEAFRHTVDVLITAQEILVTQSSYPTAPITRNSQRYRPLGLGYTNLGALLMTMGIPYDSDDGRGVAGSITALMHFRALRRSAELAAVKGSFDGYEPEDMLRVVESHRRALTLRYSTGTLRSEVLLAASEDAREAEKLGRQHGYRNAQVTVLAPTGCVVPDTLVTTSVGIKRIVDLGCPEGSRWQDVDFQAATDQGARRVEKFYVNGLQETLRVVTEHGPSIEGTPNHRVRALIPGEGYVWRRLDELGEGDVLVSLKGTNLTDRDAFLLPVSFPSKCGTPLKGMVQPRVMCPDFAYLLGFYMGDGNTKTSRHIRFHVETKDADEQAKILNRCLTGMNLTLSDISSERTGATCLNLYSLEMVTFLAANGMLKHYSSDAYVPEAVLCSTPSVLAAFISGLMDADGSCTRTGVSLSLTSERLIDEVQVALLTIGVASRKHTYEDRSSSIGDRPIHQLNISRTEDLEMFAEVVGFRLSRKMDDLRSCVDLRRQTTKRYDWEWSVLSSVTGLPWGGHQYQRDKIKEAAAEILPNGYFLSRVVSIEPGESETFDLSVPSNVTYQANGLISHNTISFMMDCETTGIEPLIALESHKALVGGGTVKSVPECARRWVEDAGSVVPTRSDRDRKRILQTALGDNALEPRAHLEMMAAVQPFLSGSISKTANLPKDATVEDVEKVYTDAWKLGLKSVAVYRDGCKTAQPVTVDDPGVAQKEVGVAQKEVGVAQKEAIGDFQVNMQTRRRLPRTRQSLTHKIEFGDVEGYVTVSVYDDGQPGEIFLGVSKEGSTLSGLLDSFAIVTSVALQYGVPLDVLVDKFRGTSFEPSGWSRDMGHVRSILDYVFRWLDAVFVDVDVEEKADTEQGPTADRPPEGLPSAEPTGSCCRSCGGQTVQAGTCEVCRSCGATSGCA